MLRDPGLIPLSHQHQHALALCVRIERGLQSGKTAFSAWNQEISATFRDEIRFHFQAEEKILFPAARTYPQMEPLVNELLAEHGALLDFAAHAEAGRLDSSGLQSFAAALSNHIRKEERRLFEECQKLMPEEELHRLGAAMEAYFRTSGVPME